MRCAFNFFRFFIAIYPFPLPLLLWSSFILPTALSSIHRGSLLRCLSHPLLRFLFLPTFCKCWWIHFLVQPNSPEISKSQLTTWSLSKFVQALFQGRICDLHDLNYLLYA